MESLAKSTVGAVALVGLLISTTEAAGPYDGQWQAHAAYATAKCPAGDFPVTIADNKMSGVWKGIRGSYDLSGTVAADGSAKGYLGKGGFTGKFSGNQFDGTFPPPEPLCGEGHLQLQRAK